MRPKKNMPTNAVDLFRSRLDQIINLKHELALLAGKIDWVWLDEQIAPLYSETGRPAVETRFMLGLLLLKHMFGLSDDEICERWVETPGAHAILVLDGAGWHTSHTLDPPHNVTLLCLPPYSPELNPVENVWEYLRKNNLALRVHDTYDAIVEACCKAWTDLLATPQRIASITRRRWAELS